jgi:hypothetical protein
MDHWLMFFVPIVQILFEPDASFLHQLGGRFQSIAQQHTIQDYEP